MEFEGTVSIRLHVKLNKNKCERNATIQPAVLMAGLNIRQFLCLHFILLDLLMLIDLSQTTQGLTLRKKYVKTTHCLIGTKRWNTSKNIHATYNTYMINLYYDSNEYVIILLKTSRKVTESQVVTL